MSRQSENSYEDMVSTGSTWRDKLTDKHTFENWKLHRHQIRTMMSTSMPLHRVEVESNGRTVDPNVKSSGSFNNVTYDGCESLSGRSDSSSKSGPKRERRVKKRVLYTLLGVIGLIGIAVPVIVVMLLRTSDGKAPEAKVGTVDLEVTIQNMQFSEALADPESQDYRNFTVQFCQEMETFYRRSSIGEKYEGCLVKELRQGSIIVVFTIVFTSEYLPIDTAVRKVFTDNATPIQSGTISVTVGIYIIASSSIVVGHVTVIANDENPTPRIGHGHSCKVNAACRTYQAVCENDKCGCGSSRHYSSLSDSCVLIPTTTISTSTEPTTTSTSTSDTTSTKLTLPNSTTVSVTSSTSLSTQSVTTTLSVTSTASTPSTSSSTTASLTSTPPVSSTTSASSTSSSTTASPMPTSSVSTSSSTSTSSTLTPSESTSTSTTASSTSTPPVSSRTSTPSTSLSTTDSPLPTPSVSTSSSTTTSPTPTPSVSPTTSTSSTSLSTTSSTSSKPSVSSTTSRLSTSSSTKSSTKSKPSVSSTISMPSTTSSTTTSLTPTLSVSSKTSMQSSSLSTTTSQTSTQTASSMASTSSNTSSTTASPTSTPSLSSTTGMQSTSSSINASSTSTPSVSSTTITLSTSSPTTDSPTSTSSTSPSTSKPSKSPSTIARSTSTLSVSSTTNTTSSSIISSSTATPSESSMTSKSSTSSSSTDSPTFTSLVSPTTSTPFTSLSSTASPRFSISVSSTTSKHSNSSSNTASPLSTLSLSPSSSAPSISSSTILSSTSTTSESPSTSTASPSSSTTVNSTSTTSTKASSSPTTSTATISSTTAKLTSTSTSTHSIATTLTSTPSTSNPTTSSTSMTASSAAITVSTPQSTQLTPQSSSMPLLTLDVIPTINYLSPQNRRLEIGTTRHIGYQVDNATDWVVVTITKTTLDSDTPAFIGSFSIINGTSGGASYGDITDHIKIDLFGIDPSVSFNLTVRFDPVMCSDGGRYHCSVTLPAYSHSPIKVSEDIDAYKMPVFQLNFPDELREGLWGLNVGCSATLGADETLVLMRKQPGEEEFKEFIPTVQKAAELRQNEFVDPDFPCIKEATYYFDTDLEGWNMTEIRCGINADTDEEALSGIGKFRIIPRSVCDGKAAGENVPHPFNCKLYVTCSADNTFWSYVHRSSCPGDQCWLSDGHCGTTSTVTTTSPGTTTPTTTLPPHLPHITCSPIKNSAYTGGNASYACTVQNVKIITHLQVIGSQFMYEQTDSSGLSGNFPDDSAVTLTVDLEAGENQISITLKSVTCDMKGELAITVNGNLSDTVTLGILSDPQTPQLSTPENIYKNQITTFNCSGNVGRLEDDSPVVTLGFEILLEGENESLSIFGEEATSLSNTSDNCKNHATIQFRTLAMDRMNRAILSCVSTSIADQSRLFEVSSTPIEVHEANIFFDKDLAYTVAAGDILSLTCSFQNLLDVKWLKISRGENKDVIIILHRNGTLDQRLNQFTLSSSDWGYDSGSVTISANITCGDENHYICETDSNSGEAVVSITVRSRPEKPTLTLSYELIEGQYPWADRLSECKAQIGDPAGNLVVEILNGDVFQEYEIEYGSGYPQNRSMECRLEQIIQFSFSNLVGLNNTEIRCAVKPAEVFNDTEKLTSEPQVIRTVDSSYCIGIDASMYVHPYDCHYFVDCNLFGSADFHFNRCDNPDLCPNSSLGICDIESCATLCNRGSKPYLRCNGNIEAEFNDHVTIRCELGNVEAITFETVAILQDDSVIFNETWASGTASAQDGSVVLTYTAEEIVLSIAQIDCQHNAVYTFLVNDLLSDKATVAIKTNAMTPAISSTRFVAGQLATITCDGIIGNPPESNQLFIEEWIMAGPYKTEDFEPQSTSSEVTEFNSSTCSYQKRVNLTIEIMEMMNGIIKFRCRTATDSVNLISEVVNVNVATQEIDIQPPESNVEVGVELSIECTVTGVSDLTYIRFIRGTESSQTVCQVTQDSLSNSVSGIVCSGEVSSTLGRIVMKFSSVQCDHEDTYVCECNPEASTRKQTSLSITRPAQYPVFTSVPKTLVENKPLLDAERFTCEVDLGYPTSNMLIIQSKKDGGYETYDDVLGVERSIHNENCSIFETVTVNYYTFDASWNNTQLRCAIADVNGTITTYVSDEITLLLLPGTFCNGPVGYYLHPYDIHLYVWCTGTGIFVYTCNEQCPAIIDGVATCGVCDTS